MPDLFVFRLTQTEGDLVGKALGKLPFDEVCTLIAKLQRQAQFEQEPPPPVAPLLGTPEFEAAVRAAIAKDGAPGAPTRAELDAKTAEWYRTMAAHTPGASNGKEQEGEPLREDGEEGEGQEVKNEGFQVGEAISRRSNGEG